MDFVSVGQGDATLITAPSGKRVLVDGGPTSAGAALAAFVCPRGAPPLDLVLLTHRHADHLGGLEKVLRDCAARLFMDAVFPHPSPAYAALLRLVALRRIPLRQAQAGRQIDLGDGGRLTLLGPPEPPLVGSRSDVNSNSVVARLDMGKVSVLLAADAEAPTEAYLVQTRVNLAATILKVSHHGSRYSSTMRFLQSVRPEVAVVSVGQGNDYGHPAPAALQRLQRVGARVYRTDTDGTVTLTTNGSQYQIHTEARR